MEIIQWILEGERVCVVEGFGGVSEAAEQKSPSGLGESGLNLQWQVRGKKFVDFLYKEKQGEESTFFTIIIFIFIDNY